MKRHVVLAMAALALGALPAHAQPVRGLVVEKGSDAPVEGAMVILLDLDGRVVHRVLTDASGRFAADADHPGPHVMRVDRIGYESVTTERFDVPVAGAFQRVTVPIRPVELVGIEVEGSRRCALRAEQGQATARAWEEARKALEAAAWTIDSGVYRYTLLQFERSLEPNGLTVREETRRFVRGSGQAPYVSLAAERLVADGFIQENPDRTLTYYAPDAEAFLSDAFLDTHCMRLREVRDGYVGLAFEPVRGRRVSDIAGTLWIEAATATLTRLEFEYVNLPPDRDRGDARGEVVFGRLPNGTWIVREWSVRMPILGADPGRSRTFVLGYRVQGGVVWRVLDREGTIVVEAATASVSGSVVDSLEAGPVAGAAVGTGDGVEAVTAAEGTFLLPGLAPGRQRLEVRHPSLDSLGLGPTRFYVDAPAGEVTPARLRLPGVEEILRGACGDAPGDGGPTATLLGRVRRGAGPAAEVRVRLRWLAVAGRRFDAPTRAAPLDAAGSAPAWAADPDDARWLATTLDPRGIFMLCGVPTGSQVRVESWVDGERVSLDTVTLPRGPRVVVVSLRLPEDREP